MLNILILCTGNSARSILGEFILNHDGKGLVQAFSAGSHPTGRPNPFALAALEQAGIDPAGAASKSWDAFATEGAPVLDLVITVCDNAAGETCPVFFGRGAPPAKVHWGYPDPAAVTGSDADKAAAFASTLTALRQRIARLLALQAQTPLETLAANERAALVQAITA
jgi:arsenate reductase (thioredoxin)